MPANRRSTRPRTAETKTTPQDAPIASVRQSAERAVDLPVGVALTVRDRVEQAVTPWTKNETREKELRSLRTQVTRELNRYERRGAQARRRVNRRARQTRNRLERQLRRRRRSLEGAVSANRSRVEHAVKDNRERAEVGLRKAQDVVQERIPVLTGS